MITAFTVQNFKAIGDKPVRIELKPITLLFGANSAGKSSILHALHYAYEVFVNRNLDVQKITMGENNSLDLGGFKRFIHGGDLNRSVVLRFELDFTIEENTDSSHMLHARNIKRFKLPLNSDSSRMKLAKNLLSSATTAYVEVEISWEPTQQHPYVNRYETGINGERIASIYATSAEIYYMFYHSAATVKYFNTAHPIFSDLTPVNGISMDHFLEKYVGQAFLEINKIELSNTNNINFGLIQRDALPTQWKALLFTAKDDRDRNNVYLDEDGNMHEFEFDPFLDDFENLLSELLVGPGSCVAGWLESINYLGPLREIPPRNFTGINRKSGHWRWATGLAAWDMLYGIGQTINRYKNRGIGEPSYHFSSSVFDNLDIINDWLASERLLNTGYRVIFDHYRELSISSDHPLIVALTSGQSLSDMPNLANEILGLPEKTRILLHDELRDINRTPHEIGTGISQVLPVVVAAVGAEAPLVVIEQPELHIHPAVQVQLGDLFITQSGDTKRFLIETHSEHLLLRILRRIREMNDGATQKLLVPRWNDVDPFDDDLNPSKKILKELNITPNEVAIYYVESENGSTVVNRIGLDESGRFTDRWPRGFFEEREKEYFGEQEDLSDELRRLFGE